MTTINLDQAEKHVLNALKRHEVNIAEFDGFGICEHVPDGWTVQDAVDGNQYMIEAIVEQLGDEWSIEVVGAHPAIHQAIIDLGERLCTTIRLFNWQYPKARRA